MQISSSDTRVNKMKRVHLCACWPARDHRCGWKPFILHFMANFSWELWRTDKLRRFLLSGVGRPRWYSQINLGVESAKRTPDVAVYGTEFQNAKVS